MTLNWTSFDTLSYTKRAIKAGFTQEQAEEIVALIHDTLITKDDLAQELLRFEERLKKLLIKILMSILAGVPSIITVIQFILTYLR